MDAGGEAEGQTGHYWNMISDKTTHLACGFGFNDANQVVMTQQFWGGGDQVRRHLERKVATFKLRHDF